MSKKIPVYVSLFGLAFILLSATIDLDNLFNYANQDLPNYINKDNTNGNPIDDKVATLGRVLFYDKQLSNNGTIACASCHIQGNGFGDPAVQSVGLDGGFTGRHSMRLINARFALETRFFWDERAVTLEDQTTQPIQDHVEMGFSGTNGDPDINDLIDILSEVDYYNTLFTFAFGDEEVTENRLQLALAQFVRSIQSFDSRFDDGLVQVNNINQPFPNFTAEENQGKNLYLAPPPNGGAGCAACHQPPEFDIDPQSLNNGIIGVAGDPNAIDLTNTRAPSIRDIVQTDGSLNGPLMHDGSIASLLELVNHYNAIPNNPANTNLDPRLLGPGGQPQNLNFTQAEKDALVAFLETLSGTNVYTDERWSDPFDPDGSIDIIGGILSTNDLVAEARFQMYPNPVVNQLNIEGPNDVCNYTVYNMQGQQLKTGTLNGNSIVNMSDLSSGIYLFRIVDLTNKTLFTNRLIKQ